MKRIVSSNAICLTRVRSNYTSGVEVWSRFLRELYQVGEEKKKGATVSP